MEPKIKSLEDAMVQFTNTFDITTFKNSLQTFLRDIKSDFENNREDTLKGKLLIFLNSLGYRAEQETHGYDLVIYNQPPLERHLAVILETKKASERLSRENPNTLGLQELVLYYLKERAKNNTAIKHLILTDFKSWFVFDSHDFHKLFVENKKFYQKFENWKDGISDGTKTNSFYHEVFNYVNELPSLSYTYFNLFDYEEDILKNTTESNKALIPLYRFFSREFLLKDKSGDVSHPLNRKFYNELLYILGLYEKGKGKEKKLIEQFPVTQRKPGSLIEQAIKKLIDDNLLFRIQNLQDYGETREKQLFSVALELCITWLNRILFIKFLEGRLISFHPDHADDYRFLNTNKIRNFHALNDLFFNVLAKMPSERSQDLQNRYPNVPYLNSSLFEPTELEETTIKIDSLDDDYELPYFSATVFGVNRDINNKKIISYLFDFMDSFDFTTYDILITNNARVINAAVLGLIFEKINGYKDGSYFTPSYITEYMCHETIRRAVVQKFSDMYEWKLNSFGDIQHYMLDRTTPKILEYNTLINSLKICDPAVGSGHFLVSALNEIIAIKSELGLLLDAKNNPLGVKAVVLGDELVFTYKESGNPYKYSLTSPDSQKIQESLFNEKRLIIENCLFGVDINPKSVQICRLRLWIELLKNAYYKKNEHGEYKDLETLPNIDINIKCGNSLVSRFALDTKLEPYLKKIGMSIEEYRKCVADYHSETKKDNKYRIRERLNSIKESFSTELIANDPLKEDLSVLNGTLTLLEQERLIERTEKEKKEHNKEINKVKQVIEEKNKKIENKRSGAIYYNALEWRFEFPEVLNIETGKFNGFDIVVSNPPYVTYHGRHREIISNEMIIYFKSKYSTIIDKNGAGKYNSVMFFLENSLLLGKQKSFVSFIVDISFHEGYYKKLRKLLLQNTSIVEVINGLSAFEDVGSGQVILTYYSNPNDNNIIKYRDDNVNNEPVYFAQQDWIGNDYNFRKIKTNKIKDILSKIEFDTAQLGELFPYKLIRTGESVGIKEPDFVCESKETDSIAKVYPYVEGSKSIPNKYANINPTKFFKYDLDLLNQRNLRYREEATIKNRKNPKVLGIGDEEAFKNPKILIRQSCAFLCASHSDLPFVYNRSLYSINNTNSSGTSKYDLLYILSLINSKLLTFYAIHKEIIRIDMGKQPQIRLAALKTLPIRVIDIKEQTPFKSLVRQALSLKKDKNANTSDIEDEIDRMVYALYGLTQEEIDIVKESVKDIGTTSSPEAEEIDEEDGE